MSGPKRGSIAAGVVAILVGGTLGINHVVNASAAGCSSHSVTLNVAAAPDIAPSVRTIADQWERTGPSVNGECVRVVVRSAPPSQTANQLVSAYGSPISTGLGPSAAAKPSGPSPAVWIPDSSAWLDRVQGVVSEKFAAGGAPSLASSPVVLGIRHADAAKLHMTDGTISVKQFAADLAAMRAGVVLNRPSYFELGIAEPRNDAAGLSGAVALAMIDVDAETAQGGVYGNIVADYRIASPAAETATDSKSLINAFFVRNASFKGVQSPQMTVAVLSEQAILAYDTTSPAKPLDAVEVDQDLAGLDYPVAVVANLSASVTAAAQMFSQAVRTPTYRGILAANGFRQPNGAAGAGFPAAHGAPSTTVPVDPIKLTGKSNDPVAGALALWSAANTKSRVLVLLNAASSMAGASDLPGTSRIQVTRAAAQIGLKLFTNDSEMGNWAFAPGIGPNGYRELAPVKELDQGNQLATINSTLGSGQALPLGGCALYSALDAAYRNMLAHYESGKINTIVIFTDCAADDPRGKSLSQLTRDLQGLASATTPVPVVLINVNPHPATIDRTLGKITEVVGGQPLDLSRPQDIVNVFLKAIVTVGPGN